MIKPIISSYFLSGHSTFFAGNWSASWLSNTMYFLRLSILGNVLQAGVQDACQTHNEALDAVMMILPHIQVLIRIW